MQQVAKPMYVTEHELPNPYQREILDVLGEEAVEVAEAAIALETARHRTSAQSTSLAREIGDLAHVASLAPEAGVTRRDADTGTEDPLERPAATNTQGFALALNPNRVDAELLRLLCKAALLVAKRCSKAKRFGCSETEPGQRMRNDERIAMAIGHACQISRQLIDRGLISADDVAEGKLSKARQLERFMQHDRDGRRRERPHDATSELVPMDAGTP